MLYDDDLSSRPPLDRPDSGWQPLDPGVVGAWRPDPGRSFPRRVIAADARSLAAIIADIEAGRRT